MSQLRLALGTALLALVGGLAQVAPDVGFSAEHSGHRVADRQPGIVVGKVAGVIGQLRGG